MSSKNRIFAPDSQHQTKHTMKKIIYTPEAPSPIGPYSQAVLAGETLYISGQIALDLNTKGMVKDSIKNETKMVMEYLLAILKAADMTFDNVVKTNIFLADMNNFVQVNEVYSSYFTKDFPARATIEARRLPKDANVEISLEAVK
jgi:2-iminobutanoate/2-iminopropanoate deaminase